MCRIIPRRPLFVLAGLALCLAACNDSNVTELRHPESGATLEGTVTYGNTKVSAALVIVQSPAASQSAFVDEDGHFRIENVPIGEVRLGVNTDAGRGKVLSQAMAQSQGKAKLPPRTVEVPPRFFDPLKSGLKTVIASGPNTFNIAIAR